MCYNGGDEDKEEGGEMKDTIYLIPNAVRDGQPGVAIRNESGYPLRYWYGSMDAVAKLAQRTWPEANIIRCNAEGQPI